MRCPYCDEEMERGYIQSARDIFWSKKIHKAFIIPQHEEEIPIATGFFKTPAAEAYYCKKCYKVIIDL